MTAQTEKNMVRGVAAGVLWAMGWVLTYWSSLALRACRGMEFLVPLAVGVLLGAVLAGPHWVRSWLISLPVGLVLLGAMIQGDVPTGMVNQVYPGYGRMSAGGGFALLLTTAWYCGATALTGPPTGACLAELRNMSRRRAEGKGGDDDE